MPYLPNKEIEKILKKFDLGRLAEAFAKGDMNWHKDEWKGFIEAIRKDQKQKDLDGIIKRVKGMKQELPKGKCYNLENHLLGRCFDCEKIKGRNEVLEDLLAKLNNLR